MIIGSHFAASYAHAVELGAKAPSFRCEPIKESAPWSLQVLFSSPPIENEHGSYKDFFEKIAEDIGIIRRICDEKS